MPRKILVGLLGGVVLVLGFVMIFTPGPALVFLPLGLLLLASEFPWAERLAHQLHKKFHALREKWRTRKSRKAGTKEQ